MPGFLLDLFCLGVGDDKKFILTIISIVFSCCFFFKIFWGNDVLGEDDLHIHHLSRQADSKKYTVTYT